MNAKNIQRGLWHLRWMLLIGFIGFNLYSLLVTFKLSYFLPINGVTIGFYFLMGMMEAYYECKSNCRI